jgi:peptide/nickel transport system permease protein
MLTFMAKRLGNMVLSLFVISIVAFIVIQLPPGDFLTTYMAQLTSAGQTVDGAEVASLNRQFGLDQPVYVQYYKWISGIVLRGDFGYSFNFRRQVTDLLDERMGYSLILAFGTMIFVYLLALPIGIYSAIKQYSIADYVVTFFGFLGLALPSFLFALIMMYLSNKYLGISVGGLFSPKYEMAPWSLEKLWDFLSHLWVPLVVVGLSGTASLIRVMRATMLDELSQAYVETARAKGLSDARLILKYPVRLAVSPFISTIGWTLPNLIGDTAIAAIVLSIPTVGPLLLTSLLSQDMYLAGSIILILSAMTVIGTFLSDLLLAWLDPRIRYD